MIPFFTNSYILFCLGYLLVGALVQQYWLALPFILAKMDPEKLTRKGQCSFNEQFIMNNGVAVVQILQCLGPVIGNSHVLIHIFISSWVQVVSLKFPRNFGCQM